MDRDELLKNIAPCGLVCYTCTACGHGIIKEYSEKLAFYLTGVTELLQTKNNNDKEKVETCIQVLNFYSRQNCPGCRDEETQCTLENCTIRECTKERDIAFCADCSDFSCKKIEFPQVFMDKWKASNARIKEIGAEQFFNEEKNTPHFLRYKLTT